jgi:methionyl-tRNA formyltransferase
MDYVEHVKKIAPDLIISYSAPQVVKPLLLSVPKYGVINVHGALLPEYRGLLPSFWYLFNDEKLGGATVHKMSAAIDDGDIIRQASVDISDCKSMFELMEKTKTVGGELMVEAIKDFTTGTAEFRENKTQEGSCFTWPTVAQAKEFRKQGKDWSD